MLKFEKKIQVINSYTGWKYTVFLTLNLTGSINDHKSFMTPPLKKKKSGYFGAFSLAHELTIQQLVRIRDFLVTKMFLHSKFSSENVFNDSKHVDLQDGEFSLTLYTLSVTDKKLSTFPYWGTIKLSIQIICFVLFFKRRKNFSW